MQPVPIKSPSDAELACSFARLWPNKEHESSAVTCLLCRVGIHYARQLGLTDIALNRRVRFCSW
jgi:hypothetical protein